MASDITDSVISHVFRRAMTQPGLIDSDDTSVVFIDLSRLQRRLNDVAAAFPPGTLHTVAVKANPLPSILRHLVEWGAGLEVASLPELHLALNAGCPPNRIVFDSPAKTMDELRFALSAGVSINADSMQEIERIASLRAESPENCGSKHGVIGLRINPQAGVGSIAATSVAGEYSKFGVPIRECRDDNYPVLSGVCWLTGIHLHIGSQGCDLALLLQGVENVYNLVLEIDDRLRVAGTGRRHHSIRYRRRVAGVVSPAERPDPGGRVCRQSETAMSGVVLRALSCGDGIRPLSACGIGVGGQPGGVCQGMRRDPDGDHSSRSGHVSPEMLLPGRLAP